MAKNKKKMSTEVKKKVENFKDVSSGDWQIVWNRKTNRKELTKKGRVVMSSISSEMCRSTAYDKYNVALDSWKVL